MIYPGSSEPDGEPGCVVCGYHTDDHRRVCAACWARDPAWSELETGYRQALLGAIAARRLYEAAQLTEAGRLRPRELRTWTAGLDQPGKALGEACALLAEERARGLGGGCYLCGQPAVRPSRLCGRCPPADAPPSALESYVPRAIADRREWTALQLVLALPEIDPDATPIAEVALALKPLC